MSARDLVAERISHYGAAIGQELALDEAGSCVFRFGEQADLGHFQYLGESECVVLWATVGFLPPDRDAPARALRILQMMDGLEGSHGFIFGSEKGTGRLVAFSRRMAEELEDDATFAGWADALAEAVRTVRENLVEDFPVEFDDFDPLERDLGDEDDGDDLDVDGEEI